jgi:hypothetical protein
MVFSNCLIAECLSNSTHAKGEHSKGSLIHDNATEILLIGNLFAHNMRRNPYCKGGTQVLILNNYMHNPGTAAIHYKLVKSEWRRRDPVTGIIVAAGNSISYGKDSERNMAAGSFQSPVEVFWKDNLITSETPVNETEGVFTSLEHAPFWPEGLVLKPSTGVKAWVLKNAGAFPWKRDAIDKRIISEVQAGKGKIIHSESEVGGYPQYKPVYRKFNPDEWDMNSLTKKTID